MKMVGPEGLEPPTSTFVASRSNPLSYGPNDWRRAGALEAQAALAAPADFESAPARLSGLLSKFGFGARRFPPGARVALYTQPFKVTSRNP